MITAKITPELIQAEIARYWEAMTSKSMDTLLEFYAHESTVFGSTATRTEPGRLAAMRREREYFKPQTTMRVQLGPADIVMLGDEAAVASYTFQLHASQVSSSFGRRTEEDIPFGRATQVFALDPDRVLRIVHEHLSSVKHG